MNQKVFAKEKLLHANEPSKHKETMMQVTVTWTNKNPDTIYNRLAAHLGREPTPAEVKRELRRIMCEARQEAA